MTRRVYEPSVEGEASGRCYRAIEDSQVVTRDRITTLRREVSDQAGLHGLIARIHDHGLNLVEQHIVAETRRRRRRCSLQRCPDHSPGCQA